MTVTRYKAPANFLGLAGSRLGLDLLELFKEDAAGKQGFEGLAPMFRTQATTKGRGGVLGYKAPKMPTTVSEFALVPEAKEGGAGSVNVTATGGSATVTQPAATPTPQAPQAPRPQISLGYGASPEYFGHEDYWRNIERGVTSEEIKKYAQENPARFRMGNVPGAAGGLYEQIMSGNVPTLGSTGSSYYQQQQQAATQALVDNLQKTATSQQAAASQQSQAAPAPAPAPISSVYGASPEYFGHKDLEAALAGGKTTQEIKAFLDQNIGLLRGVNVPGGGGVYDLVSK